MRSIDLRPFKITLAALVLLVASGAAQAGGFFDLMFNDEAADLWGGIEFGKDDDDSRFSLGGRYLYSDDDEVDASVPAVLASFSGQPDANDKIHFRVGIQWFLGEAADQDVEGVAIGGSATWTPERFKGVFFGGRLYLAPGPFAFGETERILDWAVEAGYSINPKFRAFLQYAKMNVEIEDNGDVDVNEGAMLGVGMRF